MATAGMLDTTPIERKYMKLAESFNKANDEHEKSSGNARTFMRNLFDKVDAYRNYKKELRANPKDREAITSRYEQSKLESRREKDIERSSTKSGRAYMHARNGAYYFFKSFMYDGVLKNMANIPRSAYKSFSERYNEYNNERKVSEAMTGYLNADTDKQRLSALSRLAEAYDPERKYSDTIQYELGANDFEEKIKLFKTLVHKEEKDMLDAGIKSDDIAFPDSLYEEIHDDNEEESEVEFDTEPIGFAEYFERNNLKKPIYGEDKEFNADFDADSILSSFEYVKKNKPAANRPFVCTVAESYLPSVGEGIEYYCADIKHNSYYWAFEPDDESKSVMIRPATPVEVHCALAESDDSLKAHGDYDYESVISEDAHTYVAHNYELVCSAHKESEKGISKMGVFSDKNSKAIFCSESDGEGHQVLYPKVVSEMSAAAIDELCTKKGYSIDLSAEQSLAADKSKTPVSKSIEEIGSGAVKKEAAVEVIKNRKFTTNMANIFDKIKYDMQNGPDGYQTQEEMLSVLDKLRDKIDNMKSFVRNGTYDMPKRSESAAKNKIASVVIEPGYETAPADELAAEI